MLFVPILIYVQDLLKIAHEASADVNFEDFRDVPLDDCIRQDAMRDADKVVGEAVIRKMYDKFVRGRKLEDLVYVPKESKKKKNVEDFEFSDVAPYVAPEGGRKAILLDIDGTIANHEGVRSPYDTSKYREDSVHEDVLDVIRAMSKDGFDIIVFSGRHEDFREDLDWWLKEHNVPHSAVIMREREGMRDDYEKLYLFDTYIRNNPDIAVHSVFDDRNRVVFNTWREALKIRCFHVAWGDF